MNSRLLARHYRKGEELSYQMKAVNKDRTMTRSYEAQANGVVKKTSGGKFYEEYQWSRLVVNGRPVPIPLANADFRQILSLDPSYRAPLPDLRHVYSGLIGPVLDLMTFYADLGLAIRQSGLIHAGDHAYVKYGRPNSWAAGANLLIGEDSIDFDITLQDVDRSAQTATILVRHVPPAQPQIKLPAAWMRLPVADTANNWVQVSKTGDGEYSAEVGKEIFVDKIKISLANGRILTATMDNPVEVLKRVCTDATLMDCGSPIRYEVRREIEIR